MRIKHVIFKWKTPTSGSKFLTCWKLCATPRDSDYLMGKYIRRVWRAIRTIMENVDPVHNYGMLRSICAHEHGTQLGANKRHSHFNLAWSLKRILDRFGQKRLPYSPCVGQGATARSRKDLRTTLSREFPVIQGHRWEPRVDLICPLLYGRSRFPTRVQRSLQVSRRTSQTRNVVHAACWEGRVSPTKVSCVRSSKDSKY